MRWLRIRRGPAMSSGSFGFFLVLYSFCGWYRVLGDKAAVGLRAEIYWGFARLVPGVFWLSLDPFLLYGVEGRT